MTTLVGQGLFDFGHRNGRFEEALLQHALGVAVQDGVVFVADSYNGAVRRLTLATSQAEDQALGDCSDSLCLPLGEPAGIVVAGSQRLLLSDTNNHRIVEIDLVKAINRTWVG